ncbi:HAD family hydrolase, partial [bacterium]|nr:HAD family hydrolase [bacterium]
MKPLSELASHRSKIRGICFDIDDTFSSHGTITAEAYASLWDLKKAGFRLIPVTGRPAGWCDMIARFWPVDGVVGENGAFSFYMHRGKRRRIDTLSASESRAAKGHLSDLRALIEKEFPGAQFASDQEYRE